MGHGAPFEKCCGGLNLIIKSEYMRFSDFMKLMSIFKCSGRRNLAAMLVLLLGLGAGAMAQAAQSQGTQSSSRQPESQAVRPQGHRSDVVPSDPSSHRINNARVVLVFPPWYYYDSGPNCYYDPQPGNGATISPNPSPGTVHSYSD